MIAMLVGKPVFQDELCVILCQGVGYAVFVNESTAATLRLQQEATLHIYTHVREDALQLYGFLHLEEKRVFEQLLSVSGVGPKTALSITNGSIETIIDSVQQGDFTFFTSFSRVGKKLAQKIIIELKPKLGDLQELNLSNESPAEKEVREALESLGYESHDIQKALKDVEMHSLTTQEVIKQIIKKLSKSYV